MTNRELAHQEALRQIARLLAMGLPIPGELAQWLVGHCIRLQVGRLAFSVNVLESRGMETAELLIAPVAGGGSTWFSTAGGGGSLVSPRFQGPIQVVKVADRKNLYHTP